MTDNSNIVLLWEIDNATARLATGKAESGVFNEGGFRWTVGIERSANSGVAFMMRCELDHNGPWKCAAQLKVHVLQSFGSFAHWSNNSLEFNEYDRCWQQAISYLWINFEAPMYKINDKVTIQFAINIISSERAEPIADPTKFAAPNSLSNVILKIGDGKLHVSKELLSIHSPVFNTLFFGDFVEKGKEEVEIKDVDYEEFLDLMFVIYPGKVDITDRTVQHILKLADLFQMERVIDQSNKHLMQSNGIDVMKKLLLADQYRLTSLKDQCLQSFTCRFSDLPGRLKASSEFANFSEGMKAAICERIVEIS